MNLGDWDKGESNEESATHIEASDIAKFFHGEIEKVRAELAETNAELARVRAERDELKNALVSAYGAMLTDPSHGPQKEIGSDGVVYRLDGNSVYRALNDCRAALNRMEASDRE